MLWHIAKVCHIIVGGLTPRNPTNPSCGYVCYESPCRALKVDVLLNIDIHVLN